MINHALTFLVHNQNLAPSYSVPELDAYQNQKNIQVVSNNSDPLSFHNQKADHDSSALAAGSDAFFALRLEMALSFGLSKQLDFDPQTQANSTVSQPSYFPGAVIPGPGGPTCSELQRGNLLFDQFKYLLSFDQEMLGRISRYPQDARDFEKVALPSRLFCREETTAEAWLWHHIEAPKLYFVHQAPAQVEMPAITEKQALEILAKRASAFLQICLQEKTQTGAINSASMTNLLTLIADAWFSPSSGLAPVTWDEPALTQASAALSRHADQLDRAFALDIDVSNLLPFLFELEAMTSHISLGEKRESFARGVFAGNFIDVAMAPLTTIKATEFCVRERLFDEVINLSSRGFAPVVINEYGLVADGNHRLTASYVWNILKYTQDLEWSLENDEFQRRVAAFPAAVASGLLKDATTLSPVSMHQALSHLAAFLCRPDWRARLNSYTRPLLKRHDFIHELPVVVLPEYLSGAVVKSQYDEGATVERACPSIYEAMSLNDHLVLPPRASYHFTDAALLPWFTVLKSSCGTKRRAGVFGRRPRTIPKA